MRPLPVHYKPQPPTMIVLHPNSVCDVCLEGYGGSNVPHAITCGHIFCLRCLRSLTRQSCPLCRTAFQPEDVRKLHIDKCSRPSTPVETSAPGSPESDYNEFPSPARDFHNRITHIVLDGAKATEVRDFIDEVRRWLTTQPSDEHLDLRAAYLLLFKYTDLQYKVKEEKAAAADLRELYDELKETMASEREAADEKYQKLAQKRVEEMERAMTEERNLRDRLDHVEKEWKAKYEARVVECKRLGEELKTLNEELRRLKANRNPLPTTPRVMEARHYFTPDRTTGEPMAIVEDDEPKDEPTEPKRPDDDRFQLSPIPSTATLPVSNLPNRQNFRALTAEDSDIEELKSKRANAFLRRSIDPIQIRPVMPRMNSNSSIRHDTDVTMGRSIPRTSPDVHMASCSSSPNTSFQYSARDKDRFDEPGTSSGFNGRLPARRPSVSSSTQVRDQEEMERSRAQQQQLHELLELGQLHTVDTRILDTYQPKHHSPESSAPVTRNPSPVSSTNMGPPSAPLQNTLLQRPPLSRASTAAMQAERERARSLSAKESPLAPSSVSQAATARDRDRDRERESITPSHQQISPQASLYHHRRPSTSSMRGRSSTSPTAAPNPPSGLTRSFWAMQDPQRA